MILNYDTGLGPQGRELGVWETDEALVKNSRGHHLRTNSNKSDPLDFDLVREHGVVRKELSEDSMVQMRPERTWILHDNRPRYM